MDAGTMLDPETTREGDSTTPLTEYESEQVRQIAAWKAKAPHARSGLFDRLEHSAARFAERFIPAQVVKEVIEKVYEEAELSATRSDLERQAGVNDLSELRHRPLEECDQLAQRVGVWAQGVAVAGGAATGMGGFLTSSMDVPLLLTLGMRTILKVGHCYGFALDRPKDRRIVLGTLMIAATDDPEQRLELMGRLRNVEDWVFEETEEELIEDEVMDLLLQVEVFDDIPGLGAITAGLENYALIHHVAETSRRVFQERWLRVNGKVRRIEPVPIEHPDEAMAWRRGLVTRFLYQSSYYLGFGAMLPVWWVAHALAPADNALMRGLREGASSASDGVDRTVERLSVLTGARHEASAVAPILSPG